MKGSCVTRGFWAKRGSARASSMASVSLVRIAWVQKEMSREVSVVSSPRQDLNHCRLESTRVMATIGTEKMRRAVRLIRSKRSSFGVSRSPRPRSAARRSSSFVGNRADCMSIAFVRQSSLPPKPGPPPACVWGRSSRDSALQPDHVAAPGLLDQGVLNASQKSTRIGGECSQTAGHRFF